MILGIIPTYPRMYIRSEGFSHDHFDGAGDDRKLDRQSSRLFAIDIQEDPLLLFGSRPFAGLYRDLMDPDRKSVV